MGDVDEGDGDDIASGGPLICTFLLGYRSLNSHMASSADMSSLSIHWLSESGYPFHLTKYWSRRFLPNCRESITRSISYSSSPLISSGTGRVKFSPWISVSW